MHREDARAARFEAVGRRLRRNYAFIFYIILVAWLTKILLHANPPITSFATFYSALQVGPTIPSWIVAFVFIATFITASGVSLYIGKTSSGEIGEFGSRRSQWRI